MPRSWIVTVTSACALVAASTAAFAAPDFQNIRIGRAIAPVPLDLEGKKKKQVWYGSYIVNAQGGCNDCHTAPPYAMGGDPFMDEPEQINAGVYLCGGTAFGPVLSANLTPDENGLPAGLAEEEFIQLLRTGEEGEDEDGGLLQVMPWPIYGKMTRRDLRAVYAYLSSIPSTCEAEAMEAAR